MIVAIIVARRDLMESLWQTIAQNTKARLNTGIEKTANIIPIIDVLIDLSRNCEVTASATIITTTAAHRSNRGALLKNNHQITTNIPPIIPPKTPIAIVPGTMEGTTNLINHWSITMTTPGHNLSIFRRVGSLIFLLVFIFMVFYIEL
jgi:hypothetical protein